MATMTSSISSSHLPRNYSTSSSSPSPPFSISSSSARSVSQAFVSSPPSFLSIRVASNPRHVRRLVVSSSASPLQNLSSDDPPRKSSLASFVQEIEPLDVSLIQKQVSPTTVDAVKRTISGMLGLLPSDRFQVSVEALWDPLSNLLVSSIMTGYTLHNAEYRLCLEKNLDVSGEDIEERERRAVDALDVLHEGCDIDATVEQLQSNFDKRVDDSAEKGVQDLGELTQGAQEYITRLESSLSSLKKELREMKRKNEALQLKQLFGDEKNELLNYLRSLDPEKVAELSEPTSHEVRDTIHSVVHGLLATLSPKMQSKAPTSDGDNTMGPLNVESEDCPELLENTSLQFQPLISMTRDYLARLLFWCMLLGHYIKGLEYRMELMRLWSLSKDAGVEGDVL